MTTKENNTKIANNILDLLNIHDMSQNDLAIELNVSRGHIQNIIKTRTYPSISLAFDIAEFFGKEVTEVFWREK